jgi:hypothetical protein
MTDKPDGYKLHQAACLLPSKWRKLSAELSGTKHRARGCTVKRGKGSSLEKGVQNGE